MDPRLKWIAAGALGALSGWWVEKQIRGTVAGWAGVLVGAIAGVLVQNAVTDGARELGL